MMRLLRLTCVALLCLGWTGAARAQNTGQTSACPLILDVKKVPDTSYTVTTADMCWWIIFTHSGGAVSVKLPAPGLIFPPGFTTTLIVLNGATLTLSGMQDDAGKVHQINGGASLALSAGQGGELRIQQDLNWYAFTNGGVGVAACSSGAPGLVPATGGGTANFLRADCSFAVPPGATPANCSSGSPGLVPATGGGTANFLRADCSFVPPPAPANCSTGAPGLVPSTGGGTTNFLRADCTFAAPPGGGGLTLCPTANTGASDGQDLTWDASNSWYCFDQRVIGAPGANPGNAGADTTIAAGAGNTTGAGGNLNLTSGSGGNANVSGDATLATAVDPNTQGSGSVHIGTGTSANQSGGISATTGAGGGVSGGINLTTGSNPSGTGGTGAIVLATGDATGSTPGRIALQAGANTAAGGNGGSIFLTAGAGGTGPDAASGNIGFSVETITGVEGFVGIDSNAHLNFTNGNSSGLPLLSTCGTLPSFKVAGNPSDSAGVVLVGSGGGVTACTITFNAPMSQAGLSQPACVVTTYDNSTPITASLSDATRLAITVVFSADMSGKRFGYHCFGAG